MAHFGVKSSDSRLQRPEFLGGSSTPITISEVLQTSDNSGGVDSGPQGNMAGHGVSVGSSDYISYKCEEHGYIMGIMSVMPKTAYQQGIPKHWSKFDKFDYFCHHSQTLANNLSINKNYITTTSSLTTKQSLDTLQDMQNINMFHLLFTELSEHH